MDSSIMMSSYNHSITGSSHSSSSYSGSSHSSHYPKIGTLIPNRIFVGGIASDVSMRWINLNLQQGGIVCKLAPIEEGSYRSCIIVLRMRQERGRLSFEEICGCRPMFSSTEWVNDYEFSVRFCHIWKAWGNKGINRIKRLPKCIAWRFQNILCE